MAERFVTTVSEQNENEVTLRFLNDKDAKKFAYSKHRFKTSAVELWLDDSRGTTQSQTNFANALLADINTYTNEDLFYTKAFYYSWFEEVNGIKGFSVSRRFGNVDDTNKFIDFLIEQILLNHIPVSPQAAAAMVPEDIARYEYMAIMNRMCEICGRPADIHHLMGSRIGIGGNRRKINHIGRRVLALCRIHHDEFHSSTPEQSEPEFLQKYHLYGVKLTADMVAHLKMGKVGTNDR